MPGQRRKFTTEFKKQMVQLYENGKSRASIVEEYDLTASALDRWIKQAQKTGSFSEKDNRSPEENELQDDDMAGPVVEIFEKNRRAYGTRKIKVKLHERGVVVSRCRIGRIMKAQGLVSTYTIAQYKPHKAACNDSAQPNELGTQVSTI